MRKILPINNVIFSARRRFGSSVRLCFKHLDSTLKDAMDQRNIGVIAHIDAGKTTVTERLLFLSGLTNTIGDVDDGNTITDFMDLERERGITIQSAAVTFAWRHHAVKIIDTPGHVDFTLEVERALRVMDGSVSVLDASVGVQAQTLTVWRQAQKFDLPSIFFANKMDKPAADLEKCIESVWTRLGHLVVPVVVPIFKDRRHLIGFVNLLNRTCLDIQNKTAAWLPIQKSSREADAFDENWENLVSTIGEVDKEFEGRVIFNEPIPVEDVLKTLRRLTLSRALSPLACGTALHNTESVRPVLDMIVDFLPGPNERTYDILPDTDFCALVFKVSHDEKHRRLFYTRVYRGVLRDGGALLNTTRCEHETGVRVHIPYSDLLRPTTEAKAGDVVVLTGLKSTITGDTLVADPGIKKFTGIQLQKYVLKGIELPEPVFSCSIEPPSAAARHQFEKALDNLCVEDPSLRVIQDSETGQTILQGMGELHIEVIKERLKREYDLNVFMGPLRVGYREILNCEITHSFFKENVFGEKKQAQWCSIRLEISPTKVMQKFSKVDVNIDDDDESPLIRDDWIRYVNEGCRNALYNGPLLGFPVTNLMITLKALTTSGSKVNSALVSACASICVKEALQLAGTQLIEPIMRLEVSLYAAELNAIPSIERREAVLNELTQRRANLHSIDDTNGHVVLIHASIPLSQTTGISNRIRELTSGLCSLHMELGEYELVDSQAQAQIVEQRLHGAAI